MSTPQDAMSSPQADGIGRIAEMIDRVVDSVGGGSLSALANRDLAAHLYDRGVRAPDRWVVDPGSNYAASGDWTISVESSAGSAEGDHEQVRRLCDFMNEGGFTCPPST